MKHIQNIFFLLFLCIININAQQKNTITVAGETIKEIEIKEYIINIEFREIIGDNYRNIEGKTVSDLKKEYASTLSKVNIDFSKFEEDVMHHITSYSYNTSAFYIYQTSSLDEVKRVIGQTMEGVVNTRVDIIAKDLTDKQIGELNKEAVNDARKQANIIANQIGKKIGDIVKIINPNYRNQGFFYSGNMKKPEKYYVTVTFLLEE